jgi:hypothetical protein
LPNSLLKVLLGSFSVVPCNSISISIQE